MKKSYKCPVKFKNITSYFADKILRQPIWIFSLVTSTLLLTEEVITCSSGELRWSELIEGKFWKENPNSYSNRKIQMILSHRKSRRILNSLFIQISKLIHCNYMNSFKYCIHYFRVIFVIKLVTWFKNIKYLWLWYQYQEELRFMNQTSLSKILDSIINIYVYHDSL